MVNCFLTFLKNTSPLRPEISDSDLSKFVYVYKLMRFSVYIHLNLDKLILTYFRTVGIHVFEGVSNWLMKASLAHILFNICTEQGYRHKLNYP